MNEIKHNNVNVGVNNWRVYVNVREHSYLAQYLNKTKTSFIQRQYLMKDHQDTMV